MQLTVQLRKQDVQFLGALPQSSDDMSRSLRQKILIRELALIICPLFFGLLQLFLERDLLPTFHVRRENDRPRPEIHRARRAERPIFGYYSARDFDPDSWHGGYANRTFEHMTEHATPTRSEVCYLFDTLQRGYRGVVLSDETAIGRDPVATCRAAALFYGD